MEWQQKAAALAALCELRIKFRPAEWRIGGPEPWYVEQQIEVKDGSILCGTYGNGFTPEEAILDHWQKLVTDLPRDQYLVVRAYRDERRAVRWNGFMWEDVPEPSRKPAEAA